MAAWCWAHAEPARAAGAALPGWARPSGLGWRPLIPASPSLCHLQGALGPEEVWRLVPAPQLHPRVRLQPQVPGCAVCAAPWVCPGRDRRARGSGTAPPAGRCRVGVPVRAGEGTGWSWWNGGAPALWQPWLRPLALSHVAPGRRAAWTQAPSWSWPGPSPPGT